jgi:hypothetical protein
MSVLSELFGDSPRLRVLEAFVENYNDKLYLADIARMTDVSRVAVIKYVKNLLKDDIIVKAGKAGQIQYYKLNLNNKKVEAIMLLEQYIVNEKLEEMIKKD